MSENNKNISISSGVGWLSLVILIIAFYGEPDLVDALIHWLMK